MGEKLVKRVHVWESAKAVIKVNEMGKVISVSDPLVTYCPIRSYFFKVDIIKKEDIKKAMELKIQSLGLCTKRRILISKIAGMGYGASECFMTAIDNKIIDSAIVVCEGAGTVITADKKVVQGIGFAMNALISTFPIPEIILKLEELNAHVYDPSSAIINQIGGTKRAIELGYKKIGVTVSGTNCKEIATLRDIEKNNDVSILIYVVHTSGVKDEDLKYILKSDIAQSCASKKIRKILEPKGLHIAKYGDKIPVYAFTEFGKRVLDARVDEMKKNPPSIHLGNKISKKEPDPLI